MKGQYNLALRYIGASLYSPVMRALEVKGALFFLKLLAKGSKGLVSIDGLKIGDGLEAKGLCMNYA
jgi:hypothetical protein